MLERFNETLEVFGLVALSNRKSLQLFLKALLIKKGADGPFPIRSSQIAQLPDLGSLNTKIELPEPVGSGISGKAEEIELAAFE